MIHLPPRSLLFPSFSYTEREVSFFRGAKVVSGYQMLPNLYPGRSMPCRYLVTF